MITTTTAAEHHSILGVSCANRYFCKTGQRSQSTVQPAQRVGPARGRGGGRKVVELHQIKDSVARTQKMVTTLMGLCYFLIHIYILYTYTAGMRQQQQQSTVCFSPVGKKSGRSEYAHTHIRTHALTQRYRRHRQTHRDIDTHTSKPTLPCIAVSSAACLPLEHPS